MDYDLKTSIVLISSNNPEILDFGTAFVIHHDITSCYLATCAHVIKDLGGPENVRIGSTLASVIAYDPDGPDIAILKVNRILGNTCLPLMSPDQNVHSFIAAGFQLYGKNYLAREIKGELGDKVELLFRNQSSRASAWDIEIDENYRLQPGFSGAPVVDPVSGNVIGIISHRQDQGKSGLAISINSVADIWNNFPDNFFKIPQSTTLERPIRSKHPKLPQSDTLSEKNWDNKDVVNFFDTCYLMLLLDQYDNGAWARSLWHRSGVGYTKDVKFDKTVVRAHQKKALSVTAWAGQSLFEYTRDATRGELGTAKIFLLQHRDETNGAFGSVYEHVSYTPGVQPRLMHHGNPRHTGSVLKFFLRIYGFDKYASDAINFIVKYQNSDGGWGEAIGEQSNCLSVAYILDALLKAMDIPEHKLFFSTRELKDLQISVDRGLSWLAKNQLENGRWRYLDYENLEPYYTTNVLSFVNQLSVDYPDVWQKGVDALLALQRGGAGIPNEITGKLDVSNTCLLVYILSKQEGKYKDLIDQNLGFLFSRIKQKTYIQKWYMNISIWGLLIWQINSLKEYRDYLHQNDEEIISIAGEIRKRDQIFKKNLNALVNILPKQFKHLAPSIKWVLRVDK